MDQKPATLIIKNIKELVTSEGGMKRGSQMNDLTVRENVDIACTGSTISYIGKEAEHHVQHDDSTIILIAEDNVALPGFVDAHTHLVFGGDRLEDWRIRMSGVSYQGIAQKGGGIMQTVRETRKATEDSLFATACQRLHGMLQDGSTSCEIKSGYGLDFDSEIKILNVAKKLKSLNKVDIITTLLGAHAIPDEYKQNRDGYVNLVCEKMIPYVQQHHLAEYCDVFCDEGYFTIEEGRKILTTAQQHGLKAKIHADELKNTGGAELAAEIGAVSAEHLIFISSEGIRAMAEKEVIAVLLPATSFFLKSVKPAVRNMIQNNVIIALGTDFNPGTAFCSSMLITIGLACYFYDMHVEEAITAATINAACAIGLGHSVGSLEVGKQADIILFDMPHYEYLVYQFGAHNPATIIKKGVLIH
jgi:imidazolonepropionase